MCTTTVAGQDFTWRFFKTMPVLVGTMRYWPEGWVMVSVHGCYRECVEGGKCVRVCERG